MTRKYRASQIRSLTINGQEVDLSALPAGSTESGSRPDRSEKDVLAEIERVGSTQPDWFDSTRLDIPESLDLSWPEKPEGPWDSSKNVGQYIWDRINTNPGKWREGFG